MYFNKFSIYKYVNYEKSLRMAYVWIVLFRYTKFQKKRGLHEESRSWNILWTFKYLAESLILHSTCAYIFTGASLCSRYFHTSSQGWGLQFCPLLTVKQINALQQEKSTWDISLRAKQRKGVTGTLWVICIFLTLSVLCTTWCRRS